MKTKRFTSISLAALLLILGISLTGCLEKQRAEFNNNSTEKILFKAKDLEAAKYASQLYETANKELQRSKQSIGQGDAKGAFEASINAKDAAQKAFETARTGKGEADFKIAEQKYKVATDNEGKRTNPTLYQKIHDNLEQARKYYAKTKKNYDKIIQYSDAVIEDVKTLLADITKLADKEVGEAKSILDDAKRNEAETRANDAWQKAKALVDDAAKLQTNEEYFKAIEKAKEAQSQAQEADQLAMQSKAKEQLQAAEKLIGSLRDVDAPKYTKQEYTVIEDNFKRAQQAFTDKDYRIAIDVAGIVQNRAPDVIEKAGRLKLQDQLKIAQQDIDTLKLNDADKYAPTFLSEAEALLEDAKKAYGNQEFERVKTIHKDIRDKIDLANERLSVKAKDQIREADNAIKDAEDADANIYARLTLQRSQIMRDEAQTLLDSKHFRDSILTAQNTIVKAQEAKTAAIRVKAELSLNNSEKLISEAIGNGAQLYATEDIKEAKDLLKQGRDALIGQQYTKAQDLSLQVKNKVDDSYTTMRKKAVDQIDQARKAIDNTQESRYMVEHYPVAVQTLSSAKQKIAEAESLLNDKKYSRSIESAVDSRATAIDAKNTAIRSQIKDRMPTVQRQIEEAKLAGAYNYSIEEYDKSLNHLKLSQDNLASGKYDAALDDFDASEQHAETALKGQILKARNSIETAKAIGAWNNDAADLQTAVIQLDAAEANLKARQYPQSLAAANASLAASSKAQIQTRDKIFNTELAEITNLLTNAKFANALIPDRVADIRKRSNATQNAYLSKKDNAETFTSGMESLAKLKTEAANIESEARTKQDILNKQISSGIAIAQQNEANKYAEKELNKAQDSLRAAESAYKRQDYAAVKIAYDDALNALKEIEIRKQEKEYKEVIAIQIVRLDKAMGDFNDVIVLSPDYLKQIKDGKVADTYKMLDNNFHNVISLSAEFYEGTKGDTKHDPYRGIQGKLTAGKFRQITTETYVRVKGITPPPTLKEFHNTVVSMFEEAKLAGEFFDKYGYHQEYTPETRDSMIEVAFLHMKNCWSRKHEVDTFLQGPEPQQHKSDTFWNWAFNSNKETPEGDSFLDWLKKKGN